VNQSDAFASLLVEELMNKIQRAEALAAVAHHGQSRKYSGDPYIVHPIQVHQKVAEFLKSLGYEFPNEETEKQRITMECAAHLHDVLEDCPHISEREIVDFTDVDVLKLVKELTNPSKGSKASRSVRKQMDRDHLRHVSWEAKVIKLIDRTCNLGDLQLCPDNGFVRLYANESRLLLECLNGTHLVLESELLKAIESVENGK